MANLAAKQVLDQLKKKFPKAAAIGMASDLIGNSYVTPSRSVSVNRIIGCGGFKSDKIYEIFGPPSSGKSLIMYDAIAQCQRAGKIAMLGDAERSAEGDESLAWMEKQGIDTENLIIVRGTAEEMLEMMLATCNNPNIGLQVVDSVAWLAIGEELSKQMDEMSMRSVANLLPKFLRKWTVLSDGPALVLINQIREVIGAYLGDVSTPGGHALKHAASVRIEVRGKRIIVKKAGKNVDVGLEINFKTVKNKLSTPRRSGKFNYIWGLGIDRVEELVRVGAETGIIAKGGTSWYKFPDENGKELSFNGQDPLVAYLRERPDMVDALQARILGLPDDGSVDDSTEE